MKQTIQTFKKGKKALAEDFSMMSWGGRWQNIKLEIGDNELNINVSHCKNFNNIKGNIFSSLFG